jgi:hypothetical protein
MYYVCTKPNTLIVLLVSCEVGEGAAMAPQPGRPDAALGAETWHGLDRICGRSPQKPSSLRYKTRLVLGLAVANKMSGERAKAMASTRLLCCGLGLRRHTNLHSTLLVWPNLDYLNIYIGYTANQELLGLDMTTSQEAV